MNRILSVKILAILSLFWGELTFAQTLSGANKKYLSIKTQSFDTSKGINPYICADFLQQWEAKSKELNFTNCKPRKDPQGVRLIATYTVPGRNAAAIEKVLQKKFKMGKLHFMCCYWGSSKQPGFYRDRDGYQYQILMTSGETLIKNWNKIDKFTVIVTKYSDPV